MRPQRKNLKYDLLSESRCESKSDVYVEHGADSSPKENRTKKEKRFAHFFVIAALRKSILTTHTMLTALDVRNGYSPSLLRLYVRRDNNAIHAN